MATNIWRDLKAVLATTERLINDPLRTLACFPDMGATCRATIALKRSPVSAVELIDRPMLCSVQGEPGMSEVLRTLPRERLEMPEPVAFAHDHLLSWLVITPLDERVAVLSSLRPCTAPGKSVEYASAAGDGTGCRRWRGKDQGLTGNADHVE
ncbi:hypothetical protein, partial [Halomonas ventosae]